MADDTKDNMINRIINADPIQKAENVSNILTNLGLFDPKYTEALKFKMHIDHSENKKTLLKNLGDTFWGMEFYDFVKIAEYLGFKKIKEYNFKHKNSEKESDFVLMAREDGILLNFDSFDEFGRKSLNRAQIYYHWEPNDLNSLFAVNSSFFYVEPKNESNNILNCSLDVREAFSFSLEKLEKNGKFINPWVSPCSAFAFFTDDEACEAATLGTRSYSDRTLNRIKELPDWVQGFILGGLEMKNDIPEPS